MTNDKKDQNVILVLTLLLFTVALHNMGRVIVEGLIRYKYVTAFVMTSLIIGVYTLIRKRMSRYGKEREIGTRLHRVTDKTSLYLGDSPKGDPVFIPLASRRMHTQVVGTTNAGKTESVILPWAIDDIKNSRGFVLIDGKSDRGLLDKLYAYAAKHKRIKDFRILSLVAPDISSSFNPLIGGSSDEIAERVFAAFNFEDEYYKNIQFEVLKQTLYLFEKSGTVPTFTKIIQAITNPLMMQALAVKTKDRLLMAWVDRFIALGREDREKRTSGLANQLGHFSSGESSVLFNTDEPQIDIENVMREGLIVYFQLPVLKTPTLGKATAKLALQCIQSAVSSRHLDKDKNVPFFAVYLDDFTEYLTPSFVSLLNKSRSANVGVTFAHQAQGDLGALGEEVKNTIQTNSNLKVFMRTNEPESAEYFSRLVGTKTGVKTTERQKKGFIGSERTGEGSVRDVEEFIYHPNIFKRDLGVGEAVLVVPFNDGSLATLVKFQMQPDLQPVNIPKVAKFPPTYLNLERERRAA